MIHTDFVGDLLVPGANVSFKTNDNSRSNISFQVRGIQ